MMFLREKRLMLAWLAMLAPVPLPFNDTLEWPLLFLYELAVIYLIQRIDRGIETRLPNWTLNLLGLIYIPILLVDLRLAFFRGQFVTALLHLILFLLIVKLYAFQREKEKWHLMLAIFFLFVGAMATSSHITVSLYLLVFMVAAFWIMAQFAYLHVLAASKGMAQTRARLPVRRALLAGTLLILMVAVPLFATMPRLREPFVFGQGSGSGGLIRTTGFSDSVDLSLTSTIRGNRDVVMRVQYSTPTSVPPEPRFKAATYDLYRERNWHRLTHHTTRLRPSSKKRFELGPGNEVATADVFLEPLGSSSLVLPIESLSVDLKGSMPSLVLSLDPGGAALLPWMPRGTIRYQVGLAAAPMFAATLDRVPGPEGSELAALDTQGLSARIRDLAATVMAGESDEERIDNLERHLLNEYSYTLDFLGWDGEEPLEDFLFEYKSGHCEYFASAMVLMLRSQGIPARLVTGFLGAEYNPLEDYYIVRQDNAHAWVEAYTPRRGWRVYDPTPPEGRPTMAEQSLKLLLSQFYDFLTFRWDRYVLTYGADDQVSFFDRMREIFRSLRQLLSDRLQDEVEPGDSPAELELRATEPIPEPAVWQPSRLFVALSAVVALALAALLLWTRRRSLTGEIAYLRLRRQLGGTGLEIPDSLPPLAVERLAAERYPQAADASQRLVRLYLQESFAGRSLTEEDRAELRADLEKVGEAVRQAHKQTRRRAA